MFKRIAPIFLVACVAAVFGTAEYRGAEAIGATQGPVASNDADTGRGKAPYRPRIAR
jgi:hypothetical protein